MLPGLQSQLAAEYAANAQLHGSLPALASQMAASYDNAVWRGMAAEACAVWQPGQAQSPSTSAEFGATGPLRTEACAVWEPGKRLRTKISAPWQDTQPVHTGACIGWIDLLRTERPIQCGIYQEAALLTHHWHSGYTHARRAWREYCWAWEQGALREGWGGAIVFPEPVEPTPDPCRLVGQADLTLRQCIDQPGSRTRYIPALRVYFVSNDIHLIRVSDSLELPALSLSLSIDNDNWGWQFQAELPANQLANIQSAAGPIEVKAQVNTYSWRFLVEQIRRSRSFGKSRISLSGRSLAARLDAPYVGPVNRKNTIDLNATQVLDDLLKENGVSIGWTVDWQLTDWLISAGAWSHAGTYLAGVKKVAEAAGAVIQADRSGQTLHLLSRYPTAPWDWSTAGPAYSVPETIITTEGIEWLEKPTYNAVYVSGESLGVLGHVVRTGTAGDLAAQMVTHPMITAEAAARQRGVAILADTGRQQNITLSMPLDPTTYGIGLMTPAMLIEYGSAATRGMVRSTRIEAKLGSVRQSITLETHP